MNEPKNTAKKLQTLFKIGYSKGFVSSALLQTQESKQPFLMDEDCLKILLDTLKEAERELT